MIVKYAGETALQPDGSGELASFIKRYIPLDGLRDQSPAIASSGNRSGGIGQTGVNLAQPNYPRDPEVKINQLFWPTGAARWSRGYFLFHASQITSILSSSSNGISSQTLTLTDGTTTISPSMYHLPPRKLSAVSGSDNIYLLPVVDERYYWQFSDSGSTGISDSDNWAALFSYLQGELGGTITLTSAASADYFEPDYIEFSRLHENIATIIDAACHSIGHRFVYGLDNSRKSMDVTTAGTTLTSNVASYTRIAGGSLDSPPETGIAVVFPVADGGAPSGGWHDEVSAGSGVTSTQVVRTTALAEQDDSNTSLINNTSDLSTLASKVTSDLRSWQSKSYDHAFVDLHDWEMCGHDDHLLFSASHQVQSTSLARETDSGTKVVDQFELNPTTRAISAPHNFHAGQMFHRFGETRESSLLRRWSVDVSRTDGTSSGVTDPDDYTPGNALKWNSTAEEFELSTAANKEARIEYNHDTTEIFAIHDRETKAWYGVENQYIAKVTSTITAGSYDTSAQEFTLGSGTVTPMRQDDSSPSPKLIPIFEDGSEVMLTAYNTTAQSITAPSASSAIELVWIERNRYDGRWYVQKPAGGNNSQFHSFTWSGATFSTSETTCSIDNERQNRTGDASFDANATTNDYFEFDLSVWKEVQFLYTARCGTHASGSADDESYLFIQIESFSDPGWTARHQLDFFHRNPPEGAVGGEYHGSEYAQALDSWKYSGDLVRIRITHQATDDTGVWDDLDGTITFFTIK